MCEAVDKSKFSENFYKNFNECNCDNEVRCHNGAFNFLLFFPIRMFDKDLYCIGAWCK